MNMIKVLVTKKFQESDKRIIDNAVKSNCKLIYPEKYSIECIKEQVRDADVLLGNIITKEILDNAKKLKLIQIPWTGVDFLDFNLLKNYNFTICNSHSNSLIVAEHAVALMFDIAKKISYHDNNLRKGIWNRINDNTGVSPFSVKISNSAVTIIGFGAIGQKIRKLLLGFQVKFNIVDPTVPKEPIEGANYYNIDNMHNAIENSDFVFVTVPLTNNTRGMINGDFFNKMNNRGFLINISRGEVVEEDALYIALDMGKIKGAAVDTWYNYPTSESRIAFPSSKYPFQNLNNLVMSPHRAGYIEGELPHLNDVIENLNNLASGRELINIISIDKEY